jgi:hypothetical protein
MLYSALNFRFSGGMWGDCYTTPTLNINQHTKHYSNSSWTMALFSINPLIEGVSTHYNSQFRATQKSA